MSVVVKRGKSRKPRREHQTMNKLSFYAGVAIAHFSHFEFCRCCQSKSFPSLVQRFSKSLLNTLSLPPQWLLLSSTTQVASLFNHTCCSSTTQVASLETWLLTRVPTSQIFRLTQKKLIYNKGSIISEKMLYTSVWIREEITETRALYR